MLVCGPVRSLNYNSEIECNIEIVRAKVGLYELMEITFVLLWKLVIQTEEYFMF